MLGLRQTRKASTAGAARKDPPPGHQCRAIPGWTTSGGMPGLPPECVGALVVTTVS